MAPDFEAPTVLTIGCFGVFCNLICLNVLKKSELKLSPQFTSLLFVQSFFDLLYLLVSTPLFSIPMLWPSFSDGYMISFITPKILFPSVQIFLTGSTYNTIAVAVERLKSVKRLNNESYFPVKFAVTGVFLISIIYNIPRFMELESHEETEAVLVRINNTGNIVADFSLYNKVVVTLRHSEFYNFQYFIYYNLIFSYIVMLIIPVTSLGFINFLIWNELKAISALKQRLGQKERSNVRATWSLIAVVVLYFVTHCLKHFINTYQVVEGIRKCTDICLKWPDWVNQCTSYSHIFLAVGSSVNILLYCACDRRFFIVVQKTLRAWFIWPFTIDSASRSTFAIQDNPELNQVAMVSSNNSPVQDKDPHSESGNKPIKNTTTTVDIETKPNTTITVDIETKPNTSRLSENQSCTHQ